MLSDFAQGFETDGFGGFGNFAEISERKRKKDDESGGSGDDDADDVVARLPKLTLLGIAIAIATAIPLRNNTTTAIVISSAVCAVLFNKLFNNKELKGDNRLVQLILIHKKLKLRNWHLLRWALSKHLAFSTWAVKEKTNKPGQTLLSARCF